MNVLTLTAEERERFAFVSLDPVAAVLGELVDMGDVHELLSDTGDRINRALELLPTDCVPLDQVEDTLRAIVKRMRKSALRDELTAALDELHDLAVGTILDAYTQVGNELAIARDELEGR